MPPHPPRDENTAPNGPLSTTLFRDECKNFIQHMISALSQRIDRGESLPNLKTHTCDTYIFTTMYMVIRRSLLLKYSSDERAKAAIMAGLPMD